MVGKPVLANMRGGISVGFLRRVLTFHNNHFGKAKTCNAMESLLLKIWIYSLEDRPDTPDTVSEQRDI